MTEEERICGFCGREIDKRELKMTAVHESLRVDVCRFCLRAEVPYAKQENRMMHLALTNILEDMEGLEKRILKLIEEFGIKLGELG